MDDVAILRAACCVAGLDERVDDREQRMLERLADKAGVGRASLEAMIERAVEDSGFYKEQFKLITTDPDATLKTLLCVAIADGELSVDERVILQHFADVLGMNEQRYDQLVEAARKRLEQ
jgi:tellurite resistance protein